MSANSKKITILDIIKMKKEKKIAVMTAYDYPTAILNDRAGIDILLVGDSAGMVVLGYEDTVPVTMCEMLILCKSVSRATKHPLLVADMPFMSFNLSKEEAIKNAGRFKKEGGADAVKVEGGTNYKETIEAIVKAGIPVMGHLGLTPQTATFYGGYKVQGKTVESALKIIEDAKALCEAGVFSIVLEMVTCEVSKIVTEEIGVPTIGIGSGPYCDGQVLVLHDILGLFDRFTPRHVKQYANLSDTIQKALESYKEEVVSGKFPTDNNSFHMDDVTYDKLKGALRK